MDASKDRTADYKEKIIECLKENNIKRDKDVHFLDLSNLLLEAAPDLKEYRNLNQLHLHHNKILRIGNGLRSNLLITELYLQHNRLLDINNTLQHMRCLKILWLHCNQLTILTDVIYELRLMQDLRDLNLSQNPLSQDYNYRDYVIHNIKSLQVFDGLRVKNNDREKAANKFNEISPKDKKIAFGRHLEI